MRGPSVIGNASFIGFSCRRAVQASGFQPGQVVSGGPSQSAGFGHIVAPMPEFLRKSAVFHRVRIPASRPNKHLQKPTCQKLTLAVSERFARLRGAHVFRHVGFCWFSLGSAFGHKFGRVGRRILTAPGEIQSSHLAAVTRLPTWPVRDRLRDRHGRDERGLSSAGHAARADGGDKGASVTPLVERGGSAAVRPGAEYDFAALPSAHLPARIYSGPSARWTTLPGRFS
jgi:hypothetical protein